MIRHFLDSLAWARALSMTEQGRHLEARKLFKAIKGERRKKAEYFALYGTNSLSLEFFDEAIINLSSAIDMTSRLETDSERYINLYSSYFLSLIESGDEKSDRLLQEAVSQSCPPLLRRWLPLSLDAS